MDNLGISPPQAAAVALSRRRGADSFPFASSGFHTAPFQEALVTHAQRLSVLGPILVELARGGRIEELKSVSGFDGAGNLRQLRRQAAMWDLERDAVVGRLSQAGVPSVVLKGAALRLTAYHDAAERGFGDIDVLVPSTLLNQAVGALVEAGYELESEERNRKYLEHHHHLILRKREGFVVEVHWALMPAKSPFGLDPVAFLRDARTIPTTSGVAVSVPSQEHMVLHLSQQNLEDGFSQLRRLVDVDRVIASAPDFDWAKLRSESMRMRVQAMVALTLRLCELLLGTPVPAGFLASLGISATARMHLALLDPLGLVLERRGQRRAVQDLLLLWCLPDRATRLRILKEMGTGGPVVTLAPEWIRPGPRVIAAALLKLAGYQAILYPMRALGLSSRSRRARGFWSRLQARDLWGSP
jgi:hypothetical protein